MQVFIAGVMQGDRLDDQIDDQDYRVRIARAVQAQIPDATLIDPWALHPNSVNYDQEQGRQTFVSMTKLAGEVDLLIAYLPKMSMGTAMEMWEAFQAGVYIIAVTPHIHHWAIRYTANEILPDLQSLLDSIKDGRLQEIRRARQASSGVGKAK